MTRFLAAAVASSLFVTPQAFAQRGPSRAVVPGTGTEIEFAGDDFEDPSWNFIHRMPKSSREQDEQTRGPKGTSVNGRWNEGPERGQPDQIETVAVPPFGLAGSERALLLRTLRSGIPGYNSNDVQQDDLVANCISRIGTIPVSEIPSFTVRVYMPPFEEWENRSGPHFGIRGSASTTVTEKSGGFFSRTETKAEPYWPGMWINFRSETSRRNDSDSAYLTVRGNTRGQDFRAAEIKEPGWWTFGMSFTGDGMVHYYAKPGIEDLTASDHITSQFPYSFRAERFRTYFFNVCNRNSGRTWSTAFVIDDPKLFVVHSRRVEQVVARKQQAAVRRAAAREQAAKRRTATRQRNSRSSSRSR
ncbi:MAG: hypothetical protein AAF961_04120 [Planctomycetota bacterium]